MGSAEIPPYFAPSGAGRERPGGQGLGEGAPRFRARIGSPVRVVQKRNTDRRRDRSVFLGVSPLLMAGPSGARDLPPMRLPGPSDGSRAGKVPTNADGFRGPARGPPKPLSTDPDPSGAESPRASSGIPHTKWGNRGITGSSFRSGHGSLPKLSPFVGHRLPRRCSGRERWSPNPEVLQSPTTRSISLMAYFTTTGHSGSAPGSISVLITGLVMALLIFAVWSG